MVMTGHGQANGNVFQTIGAATESELNWQAELCDKARSPVVVIKHKSTWAEVVITDQHVMTCPIGRQFAQLSIVTGRATYVVRYMSSNISEVQFLANVVNSQAVVYSWTSATTTIVLFC